MKEKLSPAVAITAPELWFINLATEPDKEIIPETSPSFREYYY